MKPVIVMPMSDPDGLIFPHLRQILPDMKALFHKAILSLPPETLRRQPEQCAWLATESYFTLLTQEENTPVGKQFLTLFRHATQVCIPDQVLHLCYPDRVAYALQSQYRGQFLEDIEHVTSEATPILFQRSQKAWQSHPENYRRLENMVTGLGELLFGQTLDFAWCHLAVKMEELKLILPRVKNPGMAMAAEIVIHLRSKVITQDVDWLSWEDPFILGREATALKTERDNSYAETQKRLGYVLPMLQILATAYSRE
jgi:hypothetical protein